MPRKRKQSFPPPKTATKGPPRPGAGPESGPPRPQLVSIDLTAGKGRAGLTVGDRVRFRGTGLYAGEIVRIEKLSSGPIPTARVVTDGGGGRQVRTIDLEPVGDGE